MQRLYECAMLDKVDLIVLEAIDEALSVLGEKGKNAVYYFFEREYLLEKEDIPKNLTKFDDCLRLVFGVGANVLEKHIISTLMKKASVELELNSDLDFVESMEIVRGIIRKRISMT